MQPDSMTIPSRGEKAADRRREAVIVAYAAVERREMNIQPVALDQHPSFQRSYPSPLRLRSLASISTMYNVKYT